MSSQNPTKRGKYKARSSRNLQLERELNRSRSSSLPRTKKKRTIGEMEDDEIRPSTSSGRQGRGRQSQKGSPSKIKRTSRSFSGGNSRRGASSSTSTQAVTSKRSKSRTEDKERGNKHILHDRKFRLEEGVDLRQQLRKLEANIIDMKEDAKLKDRMIRKLQGANSQSDKMIKKSNIEKDALAEERSSLEKELVKMRKRAEKAELELTKIQSINSATSSNNGGGEAFFQDILGNLQDFLDNQLQCTICSEVYLIATVTSW